MIGAIVLTHRQRSGVRGRTSRQIARRPRGATVNTRQGGCVVKSGFSEVGKGVQAVIGIEHYVVVSSILFVLGVLGIFLNRKNVIVILMAIELILLAVNINLVAFSAFLGDLTGADLRDVRADRGGGRSGDRPGDPRHLLPWRGTIAVDDVSTG
jgi:NADH-quinone oxidoreductase subunit K